LRARIQINLSAKQLFNFFDATNDLIKVVARACGHSHINQFNKDDLSTMNYEMSKLTGINYAGIQ